MSTRKVNISHINIYDKTSHSTPGKLAGKIIPILKNQMPGANVACGTNANFAQINRERPVSVQNNFICYSIHPQEHATDNSTLVENLKAQEYTVESACEFANGKGIWISPVSIQRRFNANIETFERPFSGNKCPRQVDSRLMSLFGACWTAGSMKYLLESGIKGVTYYETAGERGIMQGEFESRWPHDFPSKKDMIFPVYHVFRYILENKSFHVIKSTSSSPLKADLMVLSDGRHFKAIVFNFTPDNQVVKPDFGNDLSIISQLDAGSFDEAASDPEWRGEKIKINSGSTLQLKPFSVNFIKGILKDKNY